MKYKSSLGLSTFLLLFSIQGFAQDIQIGLIGGMTIMQGDFPSYRLKDTLSILANPGFGIFLRRPIGEKLAIKGSIYFSQFEGDDRLEPNLFGIRNPSSFKYPMTEFAIAADYTIFEFNKNKRPISFFILAGVGFSKTTIANQDIDDDCPIVNLVVPIGGGFRTRINDNISVSLHGEHLLSNSDCLDGFIGPASAKDSYSSLKLGISYSFSPISVGGKNIGCPTF